MNDEQRKAFNELNAALEFVTLGRLRFILTETEVEMIETRLIHEFVAKITAVQQFVTDGPEVVACK